jgi:hypothetical protein
MCVAGCQREAPSTAPDAPRQSTKTPADAGGASAFTPGKLDAYVKYQRAMVDVYDHLFRALERMGPRPDAGGGGARDPVVRAVDERARMEEKLRREAGLTADDV